MSSIRNLSGEATSSFGASSPSSNLDIGGGNRRRSRSYTLADVEISSSPLTSRTFFRSDSFGSTTDGRHRRVSSSPLTRSFSHSLGGATTDGGRHSRRSLYAVFHAGGTRHHPHHVAGEVIGSSSLQPHHHQGFSSWRPRYSISNDRGDADASDDGSAVPASPGTPPPPASGRRFGRIRSSDSPGTARTNPANRLSRSNFLDYYDITGPAASGREGGENQSHQGLFSSDSNDESGASSSRSDNESIVFPPDSDNESKEYEVEDMHDMEQPVLRSACQAIGEERERDSAKIGASENKGALGGSGNSTTESANSHGKSVSFARNVAEYGDAELPALAKRDEDGGDAGGDAGGRPVATAATGRAIDARGRPPRQTPPPGLLEKLNPFGSLSWRLIGSCVVRAAPCFWCAKEDFGAIATDRQILLRLNLLCAFFCVVQVAGGVALFAIKFAGDEDDKHEASNPDEDKPLVSLDLWSLELFVYGLTVINFVLLIASALAQRTIKDVNLVGSVRFMWALFWLLPIQIFCLIGLFDYSKVNTVIVKHWWDDPSMSSARGMSCESGTANGKCKVPILGGTFYENEEEWCMEEYNNTDCEEIRDGARDTFALASQLLYALNAVWALLLVVLMWVTLHLLQAIITLPIVQRSKESNIPLWLTLPIVGCYMVGYLLLYARTSVGEEFREANMIASAYFVSGGLFTLAAILGLVLKFYTVLNGRQRRIKQGMVIAFILTILTTILSLGTIFATSLFYSLRIVDLPDEDFREIACVLDMSGSCTGCSREDPLVGKCHEWTDDDVQRVLETIMKQSAALAAIFLVYASITLRYGSLLFRHVSRYRIEYV